MSIKSNKFRNFWVVIYVSIITAVFIDDCLSAQEQSPNSTVTIKLKVLSESMDTDDIPEIRKLIDAGADVNVINKDGSTPLLIALLNRQTEIVKLLLKAGADVNKASHYGLTPLHSASASGQIEVVKLLLAAKADVNKAPHNGPTPLHLASVSGKIEVVKLLLAAKADVNKTAHNGITPLYVASENGQTEVVKLLLESGADVNVKIEKGGKENTALNVAKTKSHSRIVELLKKYGAKE